MTSVEVLPRSKKLFRVGLFILITLVKFAHASSSDSNEQNNVLAFHADNAFLTERVNLQGCYSTQSQGE